MMERYQKAMGRIHAPADTKKKLLGSTTRPRRSVFARVLPVAACLLLLATGCVGLYFAEKEPVMPVGQSYDDIYEAWRFNRGNQGDVILGGGGIGDAVISGDSYGGEGGMTILGPSSDHYETHMQTEGVLESDLQKTDGGYLWRFNRTTLYTYRLAGGETELLESTAMPEECGGLYAMFFWEGRLALIGAVDTYTCAYLFDVDPTTGIPRLAETFRQSGVYKDSRIVNGELYLVTNHYAVMPRDDEELDIEKHIPKIAVGDEERLLKPEEIYLCEEIVTSRYYITFSVVSAIDLEEKLFDSTKAVLSNSYVLYASAESIYLFAYGDHDTTQIFRFAMDKENTVLTRTGEVEGNVLNQFSVDEHDGYLRLATSVSWSIWIGGEHFSGHHNCVYVL
ncbi:MAG: beta-propeller domain-containing protein, partial [Clostridia bacterium]|nr:beta-propeller domain-containing protein [Clostridia bacterium]